METWNFDGWVEHVEIDKNWELSEGIFTIDFWVKHNEKGE